MISIFEFHINLFSIIFVKAKIEINTPLLISLKIRIPRCENSLLYPKPAAKNTGEYEKITPYYIIHRFFVRVVFRTGTGIGQTLQES